MVYDRIGCNVVCSRKCKTTSFVCVCVCYIQLLLLAVYTGCLISASCIVMMTTTMMLTMSLFVGDADSDSVDILIFRQNHVCSSIEPDERMQNIRIYFSIVSEIVNPEYDYGTKYSPLTQRQQSKLFELGERNDVLMEIRSVTSLERMSQRMSLFFQNLNHNRLIERKPLNTCPRGNLSFMILRLSGGTR